MSKQLFIIAGPNGAGKTTASLTILPEVLKINEFVNADIIAYGLSPLNPESVAIPAGRIMLNRIHELLNENVSFAFETTLATKSYAKLIEKAQQKGYEIILCFFWLDDVRDAINRVSKRVAEGGHNIPIDVIKRRYLGGVHNLFEIYLEICDNVLVYNNTNGIAEPIFESYKSKVEIFDELLYRKMKAL